MRSRGTPNARSFAHITPAKVIAPDPHAIDAEDHARHLAAVFNARREGFPVLNIEVRQ